MPAVPGNDPRQSWRHKVRIALELGARGPVEACEAGDVSLGGCQAGVLFLLQGDEPVLARFPSELLADEPSGATRVAWATRSPLCRGLHVRERTPSFLRALLGPVQLLTQDHSR